MKVKGASWLKVAFFCFSFHLFPLSFQKTGWYHTIQNKTSGAEHTYVMNKSFGTFWVQIGQLFEAQWIFEVCLKIHKSLWSKNFLFNKKNLLQTKKCPIKWRFFTMCIYQADFVVVVQLTYLSHEWYIIINNILNKKKLNFIGISRSFA